MAVSLACRWDLDPHKAMMAALFHDLAKPLDQQALQQVMEQNADFPLSDEDVDHPPIWHGLASAWLARTEYQVEDADVLEAIAMHPTGKPNLNPIGLVLYIADYLEPSRHFANIEAHRREFLGLEMEQAALAIARNKLNRLEESGKKAHSRTLKMIQWLEEQN